MQTREFIVRAQIEIETVDEWVAEGWLAPREAAAGERDYSDVDLARAHLIRDMFGMGVNKESVPIILDLVDQLHGLRRVLRRLTVDAARGIQ